jgi:hypothetical protein
MGYALEPFLNYGGAFIAIASENDQFGRVQQICSPDELSRRLDISSRDAQLLPVTAFSTNINNSEHRVAQMCLEHDPGRSIGEHCIVEYVRGGPEHAPEASDLILIKRAFNDCTELRLEYLAGGKPRGKGPWVVTARLRDGRSPVNFVIKTGTIRGITEEIDPMRTIVFNHIPFGHYPPVVPKRCVSGAQKKAIVSMFVDRATLFEDHIINNAPEAVISALFDGPLRLWRTAPKTVKIKLGEYYRTLNVVPKDPADLDESWLQARQRNDGILANGDLLDRFLATPAIEVRQVLAHGDLHLRNIFIDRTNSDIILIDFRKSNEAPASRDPATLDVSLAFDIPNGAPIAARVSDEQRLLIYNPPLLGKAIEGPRPRRVAAILEIRKRIPDMVGEQEYQLAIAGCLIWQAWKRRNWNAYSCASQILSKWG